MEHASMIGRTITHYKILGKLGDGAMGVVYKAQDLKLDRPVALKFLPPALTRDPKAKQRFIQEAKAASALQHNNICVVHDIDETDDGQMFMVMDCYEGQTLKEKIEEGPLPVEDVINIAIQIAHGLSEAHRHGIIHRDIKPTNIVITKSGVAKIVDFGLAKLTGQAGSTQTGTTVGTAAYMSPEQVRGEKVDARTDIWSFGVVVYEMLTQRRPFRGEHTPAVMYSITNEKPENIPKHRRDVPESLQQLCKRCLEKDPEHRPQSMEEAAKILRSRAAEPSRLPAWRKFANSWRLAGAIAGVLLLAVIGIISVSDIFQRRTPGESRARVGILPFQVHSSDSEVSDFPLLIQTMLVGEFTGLEELQVFDPLSLNGLLESSLGSVDPHRGPDLYKTLKGANIDFVIDGSVFRVSEGYRIHCAINSTASGEVRFVTEHALANGAELSAALTSVSQQITDFFYVQILRSSDEASLRPWLSHHTQNIGAVRAFMQAGQYIYRMQVGAEEKYLRRAIELDSGFVAPRVWLITGLVVRGNIQEAQAELQKLLVLETDASPFDQAMINCAGAFVRGDVSSQARYLEIALDYSPGNNILLVNLAYIKYLMGEFQTGIDLIRPVVEMKWHYPPLFTLYARCFLRLGNSTESKRILLESLSMTPVDPEAYALLSAIAEQEHNQEESRHYESQYLSRALESGYTEASALAALGSISYEIGLYDRAIEAFNKAIAEDPHVALYHDKLADSFYKKGKLNEALSEYVKALEIDPFETHSLFMMGTIYEEQGRTVEAIERFRKILRRDSTSSEASSAREKLHHL